MSKSKHEIDMTKGSIFKNIISFAVPLMFANLFQLFYLAADLIVVSRWSGNDAMASVGATNPLTNLLVNVFIGISLGGGVLVSQRFGSGDREGLSRAVHTSMFVAVIAGFIGAIIGFAFARPFLVLMDTPEGTVLEGAVVYMRIIFLSVPAFIIYNFGAAILRAVGDTKRPLYVLALAGVVNIILNMILVIVFHMGVVGVGIATLTANYLSMIMVVYALVKTDGAYKFCIKEMKIYKGEFKEILRIGVPAGIQSSVFSIANAVIQSSVNLFGAAAVAGCAAAGSIEGFIYTAMNSFYQATVTAVSQNYGAKNEKRINKTICISLSSVTVVGTVLGLLVTAFSKQLLGVYIKDAPEALNYGMQRVMIMCIPYFLCGIMDVLSGILRGLGYSSTTAVNSMVGACGLRLIWIFAILPLNRTPQMLFFCWPISWLAVIVLHTASLLIVKKKAIQKMYEI